MKNFINISLIFTFFSLLFFACDDTGINNNIDDIIIPSQNVSYAEYIQPIFNYKCTNTACHDSETRAGSLDLTTWAGATSNPLIISPGLPDNSKLIWAVEGNSGASLMPPPYGPVTPLTDNQIEGLRTWITEGAKAN
ncbi:MAG: hypothetical protein H6610_10525 [Ignavibacteriales bacterium]|nr:hypothetical protein [Ignavibacteriales bacterium]